MNIGKNHRKGGKKGRRSKFSMSSSYESEYDDDFDMDEIYPTIVPKNNNQNEYNKALYSMQNQMIFAIGPAELVKQC